jgi:hypothetical protein
MRLKPSEKRHRATLTVCEQVPTDIGMAEQARILATIHGSFKKQRGGIVNRETLDISTASASFACDYRPDFERCDCIIISGTQYKVDDITNVALANRTLIFDLTRNK